MGRLPLFLILIASGLLVALIIRRRLGVKQLKSDVEIWGMRLHVSLHEIFSALSQPGGLGNIQAIKDNSKGSIIWTADVNKPSLNNAYYEVGDYTLLGKTPIQLNLESIPFLENGTREKLEMIYKRNVFVRFVDKDGSELNSTFLIITRVALILFIVFVSIALLLTIHKTFFGSFQK